MGTPQEINRLALALFRYEFPPDDMADFHWEDGTGISSSEEREIFGLCLFLIRRSARCKPKAQRKALRLLRSVLSAEQRRQLRAMRYFYLKLASGTVYRLHPNTGSAWEVEEHGRSRWGVRSFCLHDPENELPAADVTIAHLLMLSTDETGFRETANITERRPDCWNGDYLRRMRRARAERELPALNLATED